MNQTVPDEDFVWQIKGLGTPNKIGHSLRMTVTQRQIRDAARSRRTALRDQLTDKPVVLGSGCAPERNFPANRFPFRASSHFLHFVGMPLENAFLVLSDTEETLFCPEQPKDDIVWHGVRPSLKDLSEQVGMPVKPLRTLSEHLPKTYHFLAKDRGLLLQNECAVKKPSMALPRVISELRRVHDDVAIALLRETITFAAEVHSEVPDLIRPGRTENEIWASMSARFLARGYSSAYSPIITQQGQILHGHVSDSVLVEGELLLLDVGCEHPLGYASDITRTWPVSGHYSPTQKAIYDAVELARQAAVQKCRPGIEYKQVHFEAVRSLTQSLKVLGLLKGSLEELLSAEVVSYFFPHGVGHLLGLDVHDMEDLGDLAGYGVDRVRDPSRTNRYLRLNLPLEPNMVVTIEPGFYQIPQLLERAYQAVPHLIDWETLRKFNDVRGIRIEDDVLIASEQAEVLSR